MERLPKSWWKNTTNVKPIFLTLIFSQLNAQIKLTEIWNSVNNADYHPVYKTVLLKEERASRTKAQEKLIEKGVSKLIKDSFRNDGSDFGTLPLTQLQKAHQFMRLRGRSKNL